MFFFSLLIKKKSKNNYQSKFQEQQSHPSHGLRRRRIGGRFELGVPHLTAGQSSNLAPHTGNLVGGRKSRPPTGESVGWLQLLPKLKTYPNFFQSIIQNFRANSRYIKFRSIYWYYHQ